VLAGGGRRAWPSSIAPKTIFFSNVSVSEFRTPLTLLLGPLDDVVANSWGVWPLTRHRGAT
jgi:hypothetical protein